MPTGASDMTITSVNIMDEPGLYVLVSRSPVTFYIETRTAEPRVLRATPRLERYASERDDNDFEWHRLADLISLPIFEVDGAELANEDVNWEDIPRWVVRLGARPALACERYNPDGTTEPFPWVPKITCAIDRVYAPPRDHELAISPEDKLARYGVETW